MRAALASVVACLALLVAGCSPDEDATTAAGGSSEYERSFVEALQKSAEEAADRVGEQPGEGTSTEERLAFARSYAAELLPLIASELAEVEPPGNVADAHGEYVAAVRDLGRPDTLDELLELSAQTFDDSLEGSGDEEGSRAAATRFAKRLAERPEVRDAFGRMAQARAELARAGYDLGDVTALPGVPIGQGGGSPSE